MSSFFFIGTAFMLGGKLLMIKYGAAKTMSYTCFLKGLLPLLAAAAPFVMSYVSFNLGIAFVLAGAFGFQALRGMGVLAGLPIIGELTTEEDRGKYCSSIFFRFHSSYLMGLLLVALVLEYWDSLRAFQMIIYCGSIFCCIAAFIGNKIKETDTPRNSAKASLKDAVTFIIRYSKSRDLILTQTLYFVGVALIVPYSMIALKDIYQIKDGNAIVFVMVQILGGVVISLNAGRILNKLGSRNVFLILFFLLLFSCFMWYSAPVNFSWVYSLILFFIIGIGQVGGCLALNNHFLNIIPAEKRVGANLVVLSVSSVIGGVFGGFIGAGLLKFLENYYFLNGLAMYKAFFTIVLLLLLCVYLYVLRAGEVYVLKLTKSFVLATIRRDRMNDKRE
jgi:MFS family permease